MEEILQNVQRHAGENSSIRTACQGALELLSLQQGMLRDPVHELRVPIFRVVRLCLDTRQAKLVNLAIALCHRILKDERFRSHFGETENDSEWLVSQLLLSIDSFSRQNEDAQVDLLKVLLNVACGSWQLNGRLVISILSLCGDTFEESNSSIRAAAQAAGSQTLRAFVAQIDESNDKFFIVTIPVLKYICSKIDEAEKLGRGGNGLLFLLECLRTILCSLPTRAQSDIQLTTSLWKKVTPTLISVLGTPRVDKEFISYGPGRTGLASAPSHHLLHARTVYCIAAELVRLVGTVASLRPMLECLYHRMLLYPAPQHRLDALHAVAELLRNPSRLSGLAGPLLPPGPAFDLSLLRLIMDSVEECSRSGPGQITASVSVVASFLTGVFDLTEGTCIQSEFFQPILAAFHCLKDAEYVGPSNYQGTRLPDVYQQEFSKMKKNREEIFDSDSSSGIDQKSDCSNETEDDWHGSDIEEESNRGFCDERSPDSELERPVIIGNDSEREQARHFLVALNELLPALFPLKSSSQLDRAIQEFGSQYCHSICKNQAFQPCATVVNADGVYLATLMTFLFDLALCRSGYYRNLTDIPILSEEQFIKKVHISGGLVCLTSTWLREVYQGIVRESLLSKHGFDMISNHPLITLLTDLEGLGTREQGAEYLWDARRLQRVEPFRPEVAAGQRLARRLLSCCWPSVIAVLSVPMLRPGLKQASAEAISALQIAVKLCDKLGMQDKSARVLDLLCTSSCRKTYLGTTPKLSSTSAISMELLLTHGLELGSHCPNCWPTVIKVALHVKRLEHAAFAAGASLSSSSSFSVQTSSGLTLDPHLDDDACVDVYSFLRSSGSSQTVSELVAGCEILTASQTAQVLCLLSQQVDTLFEEAATKLNLRALDTFVRTVCSASTSQLAVLGTDCDVSKSPFIRKAKHLGKGGAWLLRWMSQWERVRTGNSSISPEYLLITPLGELSSRCARSAQRPLAHMMRVWHRVGPCLAAAACHRDRTVNKRAVELIHTALNAAIAEHHELPYYHINEGLFKPFEFLLVSDEGGEGVAGDFDVQDQVVSCICEFVETSAGEIKSGWRTLFGALRGIAGVTFPTSSRPDPILEVFSLFLANENPAVFASAAIDCILCLISHIKTTPCNRALSCLAFLRRCEDILATMLNMTQPVVFAGAHRCQLTDFVIDPILQIPECIPLNPIPDDLKNVHTPEALATPLEIRTKFDFSKLEQPHCVLQVWAMLIEGIHMATFEAPPELQPHLLDTGFLTIQNLLSNFDSKFGLYCMIRIIMPGLILGLRRLDRSSNIKGNMPYALGLLTDLVVFCIKKLNEVENVQEELTVLLKLLLIVLVEASWHPCTSATSPSCFRHLILSVGEILTPKQWHLIILSFQWCFQATLTPLRQLMMAFSPKSNSYYGDMDQVRVAARRDTPSDDVRCISRQIFLLPLQKEDNPLVNTLSSSVTYTFLITCNGQSDPLRLPVRTIVTSLLTHQALLQCMTTFILEGSKFRLPGLLPVVTNCPKTSKFVLNYLQLDEIANCVCLLEISRQAALHFDSRPGLKFLIQRVLQFERAANLYTQFSAALSLQVLILIQVCLSHALTEKLTSDELKAFLEMKLEPNGPLKIAYFFQKLRDVFNEICEIHIGGSYRDDEPEQGLFYLATLPDDTEDDSEQHLKENVEKPPWEDAKEIRKWRKTCLLEDSMRRPFTLSDFACQEETSDSGTDTSQHDSVKDYKREKVVHEDHRSNSQMETVQTEPTVPPEIEAQRKTSFAKDGEARLQMHMAHLSELLRLLIELEDDELRYLLPSVFAGIRRLAAHSTDTAVKQAVAELFRRVAHLYGFAA